MVGEHEDEHRRALEKLMGTDRSHAPWPPEAWPAGTRVRVLRDPGWDGPWRREFTGTISATMPPTLVDHPNANPGELAYFVAFDEPQHDSTDCGPYTKAEIWNRYLRRIAPPVGREAEA